MRRHAGIIRWLGDRRRAEIRSAVSSTGARQRAHRVLAAQIEAAVRDLERADRERVADREVDDAGGPRPGVGNRQDSGETGEEEK